MGVVARVEGNLAGGVSWECLSCTPNLSFPALLMPGPSRACPNSLLAPHIGHHVQAMPRGGQTLLLAAIDMHRFGECECWRLVSLHGESEFERAPHGGGARSSVLLRS